MLEGVDAVIHLAGISNDPMGKRFDGVTEEINRESTIRLARLAKDAGVKHFVFASSCGFYGSGSDAPRKEEDPLNPQTAFARSKTGAEKALRTQADENFTVTCLRFATACGFSERARLDLILNDFVASALARGEIEISGDGSTWCPLIDVHDMARALCWAAARAPEKGGAYLTVNTGSDAANYQALDLAEAVANAFPEVRLSVVADTTVDIGSYRVDFSLFQKLAPAHQPQKKLQDSIRDLTEGLRTLNFKDQTFRMGKLMRLRALEMHIAERHLDEALYWRL